MRKLLSHLMLLAVLAAGVALPDSAVAQRQPGPSSGPAPASSALGRAVVGSLSAILSGTTIEGESLVGKAKATMGDVSVQNMAGFGKQWSGNAQLFWRAPMKDLFLEFPIEAPVAGRYRLMWSFTTAPDYGAVLVQIDNDEKNVGYFNGGRSGVNVVTTGLGLGPFNLSKGTHKITLRTYGGSYNPPPPTWGSPVSTGPSDYFVGLDKLHLQLDPGPPLMPTIAGIEPISSHYGPRQRISVVGKDFSENRSDNRIVFYRWVNETGKYGNVIRVLKMEDHRLAPTIAGSQKLETQVSRDIILRGHYSVQVSVRRGDTTYESNLFDLDIESLLGPKINKIEPAPAGEYLGVGYYDAGQTITLVGQNFSASKSENEITILTPLKAPSGLGQQPPPGLGQQYSFVATIHPIEASPQALKMQLPSSLAAGFQGYLRVTVTRGGGPFTSDTVGFAIKPAP